MKALWFELNREKLTRDLVSVAANAGAKGLAFDFTLKENCYGLQKLIMYQRRIPMFV